MIGDSLGVLSLEDWGTWSFEVISRQYGFKFQRVSTRDPDFAEALAKMPRHVCLVGLSVCQMSCFGSGDGSEVSALLQRRGRIG